MANVSKKIRRMHRARTSVDKATRQYDEAEQLTYAGLMTSVELKQYANAKWAAVDKMVKICSAC